MLRAILYLVIAIFLITFLRMVIGLITRTMGDIMKPQSAGARSPQSPSAHMPVGGELKRDPVCGTFVPATTQFQTTRNGQTFHFCSAECRDKFA